jgi:nucleotide-binding universal stress UspA family protein
MNTKTYIVPFDFTNVAITAVKHGIGMAEKSNAQLVLLHLVGNESKIQSKKQELDQIIENEFVRSTRIRLVSEVRVGSIFEDINKVALEYGSFKIIMGTHGALGMQKIFGSNAIKVVKSTNLPIYIVQDSATFKEIKNIVVPIDTSKESTQIISHAADMAFLFNAQVIVVGELQTDETASKQLKTRLKIVEDKFESLKVKASVKLFQQSESYAKKIVNFAKETDAQLIATAYHPESLIPLLDTFLQRLIMNEEKIPVLTIQSQEVSFAYY